jgi:hypothetical protein
MADSKISDLTNVIALVGTEEFPVVQSSTTKAATINNVKTIIPYFFFCPIGDETTAITVGTGKYTFRAPSACVITEVRASLSIAGSTSGTTTIDVNKNGTSIFTTVLTIDATEKTSVTAATPAVINVGASIIASDDEITIDVDAISGGATEAGLKLYIKANGIS